MSIEITFFGDFTSPASYLMEAALWRMIRQDGIPVEWRAAEGSQVGGPLLLAGPPALPDATLALAADLGIELVGPTFRPAARKAHEAARLARDRGMEEALRMAVHHAYWGQGRDIGRIDVLQALAAEVGLDPVDMKIALDIDRYRDEVLRDLQVARALGIEAPPVVYVGRGASARAVVGAQSPEVLAAAIRAATARASLGDDRAVTRGEDRNPKG